MLNNTVRRVTVVPYKAADPLGRAVYKQARAEIGMLPDAVTMFSPSPVVGAAAWATFRESLLATGHASRAVKEAVAARVSVLNQCPFCVDAHTIMLYGSGAGDFATSLLSGTGDLTGDPTLLAVSNWVDAVHTRPAAPVPAPFPAEQTPEIIGTFVEFHFLNRIINVLLEGTFLPGSQNAHKVARKIVGRIMARRINAAKAPGLSPGLSKDHALPTDLSWAAPKPAIAAAFAGLAATSEDAVKLIVSDTVAALVDSTLDAWDGRPPELGRSWLSAPLARIPITDQPIARLALLTAVAPYQVTDEDVAAFRASGHEDDSSLVDLLSWSAFAAARRIGAWAVPGRQAERV